MLSFLPDIAFVFFGLLTVIPAALMLFTKKVLYVAYLFLCTLLGVAGLFVFLQADFLAVTQVMIYIGGTLVLLIFGVMFTGADTDTSRKHGFFSSIMIALALLVMLIWLIQRLNINPTPQLATQTTVYQIGYKLLTDFIVPFEIAGVLLLIALIGAVYISTRK